MQIDLWWKDIQLCPKFDAKYNKKSGGQKKENILVPQGVTIENRKQ